MQVTFNRYTPVCHAVTGFRILLLCAAVSASSLSGRAADQTGSRRQHCGSYCVYTALKLFGKGPPQFEQFEKALGPPPPDGYSLEQLKTGAESAGLSALAVSTTLDALNARSQPFACIAHLNGRHFSLIAQADPASVILIDPPYTSIIPHETLLAQWDGTCLLLSDSPLEQEEQLAARLQRQRAYRYSGGFLLTVAGICLLTWFLRTRYSGSKAS